jgi:FixJ family two-component response regulator
MLMRTFRMTLYPVNHVCFFSMMTKRIWLLLALTSGVSSKSTQRFLRLMQVVLADHRMPSISGVDFLETVARDYPDVQRVLVTGHCDISLLLEAINKGKVGGVLSKPFNPGEISDVVIDAWNRFKEIFEKEIVLKQLRRQNQQFEFMLRQRLLS